MKITVITVCFNSARTIATTLHSLATQTHQEIEHIIIDGGSTDGTLDCIAKHGKSLACLISEPDEGIYDAMNKGIYKSSGDIICFLNSDDHYADKNVLSRVSKYMQEGNLDALFGDVVFFNESKPMQTFRYYRSGSFHPRRLAWGWMPAHPAFFMKKEFYQELGGFKIKYRIAGDFEFISRAFTTFPIRYKHVPEVLVRMRMGGKSTESGFFGRIQHNKELLMACRENGIRSNLFKLLLRYPLKLSEFL